MRKILGLILCFTLTGCATMHTPYQIRTLPASDVSAYPDSMEQNGVTVAIKVLTPKEAEAVVYHPLLKSGIQPILVVIQNGSSGTYRFYKKTVSPTHISARDIYEKRKLHGSMTGEGLKLLVPRPLGSSQEEVWWNIMFTLFSPLLIPTFIMGDLSEVAWNSAFKNDLWKKEFKDGPIRPGQTKSGLIFLSREKMSEPIRIELAEKSGSESLVFHFEGRS